ncbi:MAG: 1-phosphofructokinase family hexose kinase [Caldilineaceae bacterium]|nr:1-phosphofructokinase family hexose kinase [Caldilineaceae bacterium]
MIYTVSANPAIDMTLTVPELVFEEVLRATAVSRVWGGKAFNVSRTLKRLGLDSVAMAFAGGYTGQGLQQGLESEGIATDFVEVAGETRTNVVFYDATKGTFIKVNQPGAAVSEDEHRRFLDRARARVAAGDIWVMSGSLPPGLPTHFYAELVELLHAGNARAVLDTSGKALHAGCAARPWLVKPNVEEARELTGRPVRSVADGCQAAGAFLAAGAQQVALSLGAQGLIFADGTRVLHTRPPQVPVLTAVGAGDALLGGLVWALSQGKPVDEVARWGVTTGTTYAMNDALPENPWEALAEIYRQVQVETLH